MPLTTYAICAYQIEGFDMDSCIDWAYQMVEAGYDTPHLLMLAGVGKPTMFAEAAPYVEAALRELGLPVRQGEDATLSFIYYCIRCMADGRDVKQHLYSIYPQYWEVNFREVSFDIWSLYEAWLDIEYYPEGYQYYWEGANATNIERIVIEEAKKWINEASEEYKRILLPDAA